MATFLSNASLVARYVPGPSMERGHALNIYAHPKEAKLIYGFGKFVVVKSLDSTDHFVFRGHKYAVGAAQFSPSGCWVASGDAGGFLKVWAWDNPEHSIKLDVQALGGAVLDVAWDADSKRICICGDGKGVVSKCVMWDTGNTVGEMVGHQKKALTCAYKQSRPYRIFTGSEDYRVVFYKGPPFKMDHSCTEHKNYVNCIRFSATGDVAVSVGSDKKIVVYDGAEGAVQVKDFKPKAALKHHQGSIYSVAFNPEDADFFITASADKTVKLWTRSSSSDGSPLVTSLAIGKDVADMQNAVLWPPKAPGPLSLSLDGTLNFLAPDLSKVEKTRRAPRAPISALAMVGDTPVVGCNDGTVFMIQEDDWVKCVNSFNKDLAKQPQRPCHAGKITAVVALSETTFATCGFDDKVKPCGGGAAAEYLSDGVAVDGQPCALATAGDDATTVYAATTRGVAKVSAAAASSVLAFEATTYDPTAIAVSSVLVVVGAKDGTLRALDPSSLAETKVLPAHRGEITALTFAPDGQTLAVGDADRDIKLYAVPDFSVTLQSLWRFHTSRVTALAWRPDSKFLASTASDESIFVWNADKPSDPPAKFEFTHKDGVTGLAWQGQDFLLSVGNDANALKWKPLSD